MFDCLQMEILVLIQKVQSARAKPKEMLLQIPVGS